MQLLDIADKLAGGSSLTPPSERITVRLQEGSAPSPSRQAMKNQRKQLTYLREI